MSVNLLKTIKKIKPSFCKFLLFHLAFILKRAQSMSDAVQDESQSKGCSIIRIRGAHLPLTYPHIMKGHSGTQEEQLSETRHEAPATLSQCWFVITWDKKMSGGLVHVLTKRERLFVFQGAMGWYTHFTSLGHCTACSEHRGHERIFASFSFVLPCANKARVIKRRRRSARVHV